MKIKTMKVRCADPETAEAIADYMAQSLSYLAYKAEDADKLDDTGEIIQAMVNRDLMFVDEFVDCIARHIEADPGPVQGMSNDDATVIVGLLNRLPDVVLSTLLFTLVTERAQEKVKARAKAQTEHYAATDPGQPAEVRTGSGVS